ncbi:MAG TPA: hypothetical protein VD838_03805, partial [Anaeromyxobacteraceae bacterium]|nr:hypothetical protein [Anaeromyxobacteraceae bacterium]
VTSFPIGNGGDVILAILGVPVPQDAAAEAGVVPAVAGAARFLVAMNAGRLAVIRAERQGDGSVQLRLEGTLALGGAAPFDVVSLAASPDGRHVYAASQDLVTGSDGIAFMGVAEIDTLGDDPAAWTVRAIDARAGTYGVAAARVVERSLDDADVFDYDELVNGGRLLVYALPDRSTCGPTRSIDCGILTLDPETGRIAEDPVGEMPYRAPMTLPVLPIAITTWDRVPEAKAAADVIAHPGNTQAGLPAVTAPGIRYAPGTGSRVTSALALVTGADGLAYSVDLGRWGPGSDQSLLREPLQTRVYDVSVVTDPRVAPQIGMWREAGEPTEEDPTPEPELQVTAATLGGAMLVTPGYTPDDRWTLGWQYPLSGLEGRRAELVRDETLGLVLAMHTRESANGAVAWRDVVGLYSPQLGVHVGDVVEIGLNVSDALPEACEAAGEGRVARILPPDPERWPGGALVLSPPVDPPVYSDTLPREQVYACWEALAAGVHA